MLVVVILRKWSHVPYRRILQRIWPIRLNRVVILVLNDLWLLQWIVDLILLLLHGPSRHGGGVVVPSSFLIWVIYCCGAWKVWLRLAMMKGCAAPLITIHSRILGPILMLSHFLNWLLFFQNTFAWSTVHEIVIRWPIVGEVVISCQRVLLWIHNSRMVRSLSLLWCLSHRKQFILFLQQVVDMLNLLILQLSLTLKSLLSFFILLILSFALLYLYIFSSLLELLILAEGCVGIVLSFILWLVMNWRCLVEWLECFVVFRQHLRNETCVLDVWDDVRAALIMVDLLSTSGRIQREVFDRG